MKTTATDTIIKNLDDAIIAAASPQEDDVDRDEAIRVGTAETTALRITAESLADLASRFQFEKLDYRQMVVEVYRRYGLIDAESGVGTELSLRLARVIHDEWISDPYGEGNDGSSISHYIEAISEQFFIAYGMTKAEAERESRTIRDIISDVYRDYEL
jgi:hypothetical protein